MRGRAFRYNLYSVILLQRQVSLYQLHSRFFILAIQKEREEGSWSWRSEKERDGWWWWWWWGYTAEQTSEIVTVVCGIYRTNRQKLMVCG